MNYKKIFEDTAYVRMGGTAEELQCAQYLKQCCADLGLEARIEAFEVVMAHMEFASLTVDGKEIPQNLDADSFWHWESDSMFDPNWKRGWYYDHERKLCCIHPGKFSRLTVSFSTIDLIKIDGDKKK